MNIRTSRRVLVTVVPFGETDRDPIQLLDQHGINFSLNTRGRRLTEQEVLELIPNQEVLIAGTEPLTERVLEAAPDLRLIARAGIGLDNVALAAARARGIAVTYTPDAPTAAVAELTIGQMITLLRRLAAADRRMHQGMWRRDIGRSLSKATVGVIGVGRAGRAVIRHLQSWNPMPILTHDLVIDEQFSQSMGCIRADPERIYREADVITLHVPLTHRTRHMIGERELSMMKTDAILINTARGEIVDESALAATLRARPGFSAAIDVFAEEPYSGELASVENCVLSCHMGSATRDCRLRMEMEATEEVIRYFRGEPFSNPVPEAEYGMQV